MELVRPTIIGKCCSGSGSIGGLIMMITNIHIVIDIVIIIIIGLVVEKDTDSGSGGSGIDDDSTDGVCVCYIKLTSSRNDTDDIPLNTISLLQYICEMVSVVVVYCIVLYCNYIYSSL